MQRYSGWARRVAPRLGQGQPVGASNHETPARERGVIFWTAIVGDCFVGPYKVEDGVKMNAENYTQFLDDHFFKCYKAQSRSFKIKPIFMHDNCTSHAVRYTTEYLLKKGLKNKR